MIYTKKTKKALGLCFEAHKEQLDKSGLPYVFHPFHLAEQMQTEETVVVALLHDVMEDTSYTAEDLKSEGFDGSSSRLSTELNRLTHAASKSRAQTALRQKAKSSLSQATLLTKILSNSLQNSSLLKQPTTDLPTSSHTSSHRCHTPSCASRHAIQSAAASSRQQ